MSEEKDSLKSRGADKEVEKPLNDDGTQVQLSEIDQLRQELESAKNETLYLRAEFDNFRKNAIKERSDLLKFGSERFVRELLDVMDTFEMALSSEVNQDNYTSFVKGIELTASNLQGLLTKFSVEAIDPKGEMFDPQNHEALGQEPSDQVAPGTITQVFKKAYKMHDKLIRPAQVVVAAQVEANASKKESH